MEEFLVQSAALAIAVGIMALVARSTHPLIWLILIVVGGLVFENFQKIASEPDIEGEPIKLRFDEDWPKGTISYSMKPKEQSSDKKTQS